MMKSNKLLTQQQQEQETEQIPQELVEKFDGDKELVQEFMEQGYSISDLQASTVTHPTRFDPMVSIGDKCIGFWIDKPSEMKWRDDFRTYQNRFRS